MRILLLSILILLLILATLPAGKTRIIDWVGLITDKRVYITEHGFNSDSLEANIGEDITFYNRSNRALRVVATGGINFSSPLVSHGSSARMRFPRMGIYHIYCDKPCKTSMIIRVNP
jgi:plastocyanin